MKVLCIIDDLAPGGAQRQLLTLMTLMKASGVEVSAATYSEDSFFLPALSEAGISHIFLPEKRPLARILAFRRLIRRGTQDAVLAFLRTPSLLAELSAVPWRRWGLVVSERDAYPGFPGLRGMLERVLHGFADFVTTNSKANEKLLAKQAPWLAGRVVTIYNTLDLDHFRPADGTARTAEGLRLLGIGRVAQQKNVLGLVQALALARAACPQANISVDWYGKTFQEVPGPMRNYHEQILAAIARLGLEEVFRLRPPTPEILDEYRASAALILPSFHEGLPNVACEAMACGLPLLLSDICDNAVLARPGENGILFDPGSPEKIARALIFFASLSLQERLDMGARSRQLACELFDQGEFVQSYLSVLEEAAARRSRTLPTR